MILGVSEWSQVVVFVMLEWNVVNQPILVMAPKESSRITSVPKSLLHARDSH